MKHLWAPWILLVVLWIVTLQSDETHGKTISRDQHGLDERMVRRNRTRLASAARRRTKETPHNSSKTAGTTLNDEDSQSEEAENPLSSSEMATILNALSTDNSTSAEYEYAEEDEEESKFSSSTGNEITMEHVDFVMLRLQHISRSVSNNLTEILALQKKEFALNPKYEEGWEHAVKDYNRKIRSRKDQLFSPFENNTNSVVYKVPEEYHIAVMAYTNDYPSGDPMYYYFNKATREVCSGKDVEQYHFKSFFKLLELAIKELNKEPKLRDTKRFLYRGIRSKFVLEEGQILAFQQFVSTSTQLKVAEEFADQTLLEIEGYYDTGLNADFHSEFAEEEVLFYPLQVFKVDSIHVGKHYTRYVLIGHKWEGVAPANKGKGCKGIEGNDVDVDGNGTLKTTANKLKKNGATTNKQVTSEGSFLLLLGIVYCAFRSSN